MMNRRTFFKSSGLALVAGGLLPNVFVRMANASTTRGKQTLVAIFQRGAVDGLNVIVPYGEKAYYDARPTIAVPREQVVDLDGYGQSVPAYASANAGSAPPAITVSPMGKRVVDLFFPLPAQLQRAERLPSFDVVWKLRAEDKEIAERTPFERIAVEPPPSYDPIYDYGADYYWGPPYFYDPLYGNRGYYRGAGRYAGHPMYIHRSETPGHFAPRSSH